MRSIVKVSDSMFPEIYDSLLRKLDPRMPHGYWQRAFMHRGWHEEDHLGYALCNEGKFVGVLGTLYSQREVNGQRVNFCNLHSWIVEPEYRASSLLLMRPVLSRKDLVLTDLSATAGVVAISRRMGFTSLGIKSYLLPPVPRLRSSTADVEPLEPGSPALDVLSPADRRIFADHQDIDCQHLLIQADEGYCYVVASSVASRVLRQCSIHYVSHPGLFVRHQPEIRRRLLSKRARYAVIDARLLGHERLRWAVPVRTNEKLARFGTVTPPVVDSLYSEVPLLKLPAYNGPGVRTMLRNLLSRTGTTPADATEAQHGSVSRRVESL